GQQPTNTPAGTTISPAVTVRIVDPYNNLTNSTASVSLAMGSNPSGGTLSGTTTKAAVAGVATFSDLSIDKKGIGYTLLASSSGLTGATSNAFNITGAPATHFSVVASMDPVTAGSAFSVTVTALDGNNNVVSDYTGTVHFTSSDSGAGRVLPADYTFTVNGVISDNGVHTFTNGVTLVTAGSQTITVTDTVASPTVSGSATVTVNAAGADHIVVIAGSGQSATVNTAFA